MRRLLPLILAAAAGCARGQAPAPSRHADIELRSEIAAIDARVPRNATLDSILRDAHVSASLVDAAVASARSVFDVRRIRTDNPYRVVRSLDGLLQEFEYQIDADRFLRIVARDRAQPERPEAAVLPYEKDTSIVTMRGRIDSDHPSLIAAVDGSGENIQLALALAEIFAGQIDFDSDLQPGDSFEVLFEKSM